jgi:hypothetical protein
MALEFGIVILFLTETAEKDIYGIKKMKFRLIGE